MNASDILFYGAKGGVQEGVPEQFQSFTNSPIFNSVLELNRVQLERLTQFISGRHFLIPLDMAKFMELVLPKETDEFKALMVSYCVGVDGFSDLSLSTTEVNSGNEHQSAEISTGITGMTKEITLNFPAELRGQFLRKYVEFWLKGIYDPMTNRATYLGAIDDGRLRYTEGNQTMSALFFTVDPSWTEIESCAYLTNMSPKSAMVSINNSRRGEHSIKEVSIPFKVQYSDGNIFIHEACKAYLKRIVANTSDYHTHKFEGVY
ncbi:MAG: hypothetical protein ACRCZ9_12310 [Fusobacteriaceae bacterium]